MSQDIVLSYGEVLLRKNDLKLLDDHNWINDSIISFWFEYLNNKYSNRIKFVCPEVSQLIKSAYFFNQMIDDLNFLILDDKYMNSNLWLIPINDCEIYQTGGTHWSLLVFYKEQFAFDYLDSQYNSSNKLIAEYIAKVLMKVFKINHKPIIKEVPCLKQNNSYDCGIHMICNAEAYLIKSNESRNEPIYEIANFDMINNKRNLIKEIIFSFNKTN